MIPPLTWAINSHASLEGKKALLCNWIFTCHTCQLPSLWHQRDSSQLSQHWFPQVFDPVTPEWPIVRDATSVFSNYRINCRNLVVGITFPLRYSTCLRYANIGNVSHDPTRRMHWLPTNKCPDLIACIPLWASLLTVWRVDNGAFIELVVGTNHIHIHGFFTGLKWAMSLVPQMSNYSVKTLGGLTCGLNVKFSRWNKKNVEGIHQSALSSIVIISGLTKRLQWRNSHTFAWTCNGIN